MTQVRPDVSDPLAARIRPDELGPVYPHRWAIPRETWIRFFSSAQHEIGILAYSALFLAEDGGILQLLAAKARRGVRVQIALGDPDSRRVKERGEEEGIGEAMPGKIRNALTLYRPLAALSNFEIRLHQAVLYNSIYRANDQLLVNQHAYGVPASHSPAFAVARTKEDGMAEGYLDSFERIWAGAAYSPAGHHGRCV